MGIMVIKGYSRGRKTLSPKSTPYVVSKININRSMFKIGLCTTAIALLVALQTTHGQFLGPLDNLVGGIASGIAGISGKLIKTFVYGTGALFKYNNQLICPFSHQEGAHPPKEPTMYIFVARDNDTDCNCERDRDQAMAVYADDRLDEELFAKSKLLTDRPTIFVIHGWLGSVETLHWPTATKDRVLGAANSSDTPHQVILVDWHESASGSLYKVFNNNFVIGKRLAAMFRWLADVGKMDPSQWHCMGHSYGTHICGIASREAFGPRQMGRITGLDPGGFCFELGHRDPQNYYGLRPTDARQVDAYVTNRSPFGNRHNLAQFSVRVGDGSHQTKHCSVWTSQSNAKKYFLKVIQFLFGAHGEEETLVCDHYFSTRFAYQLLRQDGQCQYVAYLCHSYADFVKGRCGVCDDEIDPGKAPNQCYLMDFSYQQEDEAARRVAVEQRADIERHFDENNTDRRLYFMLTAQEDPYCAYLFHVRLILMEEIEEAPPLELWFEVAEDANATKSTDGTTLDGPIKLFGPWPEHRDTLTAVMELDDARARLAKFVGVTIYDRSQGQMGRTIKLEDVASVQVTYMSSMVPEIRKRRSFVVERDRVTMAERDPSRH